MALVTTLAGYRSEDKDLRLIQIPQKARAVFLDHRLLDLPWLSSLSCADLLRYIHTLLNIL